MLLLKNVNTEDLLFLKIPIGILAKQCFLRGAIGCFNNQ